jgi:amino acid adenylation domain-containing protein
MYLADTCPEIRLSRFMSVKLFDAEQSLPAHFCAQVAMHGDRPAIGTGDWRPTYARLDMAANRFAHALTRAGAKPGDRIAIVMQHDGPQIAASLAALKAGATVVVLNRTDPPARLRAIIGATEPTLMVTDDNNAKLAADVWEGGSGALLFDAHHSQGRSHDPGIALSPHATAVLMYTSGSSGRPKIVKQTHRFVLHNALRHTMTQRLHADDRIALIAALSGAQGMGTAWSALANGASLFLHATMEKGVADLACWLNEHRITIYVSASSVHRHFMRTLDDGVSFPSVRLVQVTSEWATAEDFRTYQKHFPPPCEFIHGLGSSETGNVTRMRLMHGDLVEDGRLPIGQPSEGIEVLIVDQTGQPVAPGQTGEMLVRSRYLTDGYWRDEALTRERFGRDPATGLMTYRGGDLARINALGHLEFMGRKDAAVKVGGFYVDPSTAEAALVQLAFVERAAIVPGNRPNGEALLAGYVQLRAGQTSSPAAIRRALRDILPRYMVPSVIRIVDNIPLTPQGKIDRERLKHAQPLTSVAGRTQAPATATETLVAEIWSAEFGIDQVGRHDDFFDLGGDSLIAAVVAARLQDARGVQVSLGMIIDHPSLSEFALAVDQMATAEQLSEPPLVRVSRDKPLPLSPAQKRIWNYCRNERQSIGYIMAPLFQIIGPLDANVLQECISEMARRHEMLRTTFSMINGEPAQSVQPPSIVPLPVVDLTGSADPGREANVLGEKDVQRGLDLLRQPAVRFKLYKIRETEHWLSRISHHIISDAWSWTAFFNELDSLYAARMRGADLSLPKPNVLDYCDYAVWQQAEFNRVPLSERKSFKWWRNEFATKCETPILPFARATARTDAHPSEGVFEVNLGQEITRRLDELGRKERATQYAVRLSAFAALLAGTTGKPDVLVGSYVANRTSLPTQSMFGLFANFAPVRISCRPQMTFRELLAAVTGKLAAIYSVGEIPFDELRKELSRVGVAVPEVKAIVLVSLDPREFELGDLVVKRLRWSHPASMPWGFTMTFVARTEEGRVATRFDAGIYDPAAVHAFVNQLCRVCDAVARRPDRPLSELLLESGVIWNGDSNRLRSSSWLRLWPRRHNQ